MSRIRKRLSNEERASRLAFDERLSQAANDLEDRAWRLPLGPERDALQGSPHGYSQTHERMAGVAATSGAEMKKPNFPEALRDYRAFILGPDGHVIDRHDMFCANDDEAAKTRTKQLVNGHDVELWHHDRKLADFKHEE
jgi:hypothetical protein